MQICPSQNTGLAVGTLKTLFLFSVLHCILFDGKYLFSPCKVDHFPTLGDVEVMEGGVEGALEADGRADAADLLIVGKTAMHDGRFDQSDLGDVAEEIHFEI